MNESMVGAGAGRTQKDENCPIEPHDVFVIETADATANEDKRRNTAVGCVAPRFQDLRWLLLRQLSVMVHDVPADQFTEDGAGHDIGREMIQTADAREADGCCES